MTLHAPKERRRRSVARRWGAVFDVLWIGSLALLIFGVFCAQESGVLRIVATAASVPFEIVMSTPAHTDQRGSFIDHAEWTTSGDRASLRVYPTSAGRNASARFIDPAEAWTEVVALDPDADRPGMREQFVCHWRFAEIAEPGKVSWNLEPWRPIVNGAMMIESRCNPGGAEESL